MSKRARLIKKKDKIIGGIQCGISPQANAACTEISWESTMRFALFVLLVVSIRGDSSRNHEARDVLECLSKMDAECVVEALRRGRTGNLMPRRGVPPGKDVTLEKIAGSDLMDSDGKVTDRSHFHTENETVSGRGDHTGNVWIPMVLGLKFIGLLGVAAMKHFLLKATLLAKMSLIVSVWLIYRALSQSAQKYKDLLQPSRNQYPENEPDLSGHGYMSTDGYQYHEEDLILAALNKTLISWPGAKWRIVSSHS